MIRLPLSATLDQTVWLATDPILHAGITADLQTWYGL